MSAALGGAFIVGETWLPATTAIELRGVIHYLGVLNLTLAAFNMAPAFPLDGGRVLRALIWLVSGDANKATRIAARAGELVGIAMIAIGALAALSGQHVGGLWWIALGWFIYAMARAHRSEAEATRLLSGARVGELMTPDPVTAEGDISVAQFVEDVLARFPHDLIPVIVDGRVVGGAGFKEVRAIPRERWGDTALADIATPLAEIPVAEQDEPVESAFERMREARASRLLVLARGRLTGVLTLKDIMSHVRFRAEFGRASA
jgi:CBS domain-containing protein